MPEGPRSGAFWRHRLMDFYSGLSMHFYSGVDTNECHRQKLDYLLDEQHRESLRNDWVNRCHLQSWDFQKIKGTDNDLRKVVDYSTYYARQYFHAQKWDEMYQIFPQANSEFRKLIIHDQSDASEIRENINT